MSAFDPQSFLDAQTSEVNERRPPLPVENPASPDGLYTAIIGEPTTKTGEKDGKPWVSILVPLQIEVPQQLQEDLKLQPQLTLTDRVFVDLTPAGTIDNAPGRNRGQRNYREALDLNKPGDVWAWRKAQGGVVKVKIQHDMYEGNVQERIGGVYKRS